MPLLVSPGLRAACCASVRTECNLRSSGRVSRNKQRTYGNTRSASGCSSPDLTSCKQVYWTWYGATVSSPLISTLMRMRIAPDTADLSVRLSVQRKKKPTSSISSDRGLIRLTAGEQWDKLTRDHHRRSTKRSTDPDCTRRPSLRSECGPLWWFDRGSRLTLAWTSASHET